MAPITPAYAKEVKVGVGRMVAVHFTTVSDGDTWASGLQALSTKPFFLQGNLGDPGTQAAGGGNVDFNTTSGAVTFHPSTDSLGLDLLVIL